MEKSTEQPLPTGRSEPHQDSLPRCRPRHRADHACRSHLRAELRQLSAPAGRHVPHHRAIQIVARRHVASLYTNTGSHRSGRETVLPRSGSRHTLHVAGKRYAPRGGRPAGSDRQRPPVRQFVLRRLPPTHPDRRESAYGTGEREQRLHLVAPCRNAGHRHRGDTR